MSPLELSERLPFCGCGLGDSFTADLHDYLKVVAANNHDPRATREDYWELLAHIADHAELTEHGGSVYSPRITDDGRAAIALWDERGTEDWAWEEQ